MATITVSNVSGSDAYCSDLYCSIAAGKSVSTTRSHAQLQSMASLQALIAAGTCTVSIAYSATEKASGLVEQGESAVATTGLSEAQVLRVAVPAGAGGAPDDITVFAVGTNPYAKMRIVDAMAYVSAGASGGRTLQVRSASAGAGTLCAEMGAAANGRQAQTVTVTASQVLTSSGSVGLFIRRSDSAIAGEVLITLRPEV